MNNNPNTDIAKPKENLRQRAYLNSVTSVIDYGAQLLTKFFVTPFLVSGLGSTLFGVWNVLGQFTSYANLADIKVTQVLKWAIAKDRDSISDEELRKYVTATFLLVLLILPIILTLGAIIIWFAPEITGVGEEHVAVVRITASILLLALVINKVFDIFESILRGMNLSFKRIGVRAAVIIIGGVLQVTAILLGYGLIALAMVQVFIMLSMGITIYFIMNKYVPWFGWGEIDLKKSLFFFKTSGWFVGWTGTRLLLLNTDKVILGYLAGPVLVTQYVITQYLANAVHGIVKNIINGVFPGIGKLYGNREYEKLMKVRKHVMLLTWLFAVSIGSVIILFNESFIELWVTESEYAGQLVNLLILLSVIQYLFIQNDSVIIDTTLELSQKVYFGLVAAIISVGLMFATIPNYGIAGLCLSMMIGRSVISIAYPAIIYIKADEYIRFKDLPFRPLVTILVLWYCVYRVASLIQPQNWTTLGVSILISLSIITPIAFYSGIDKNNRIQIISYFKSVLLLKND